MEQQGGTQVPSPLPTRRSVSFDQQQAQPEPSAAEEGIPGVDAAIGGADDAEPTLHTMALLTPEPVLLVEHCDGGRFKPHSDGLDALRRITAAGTKVVCVAGPYRQGKSYLANKLMGQQSGFGVGHTMEGKTRGVWMWAMDRSDSGEALVVLDTEGLDDPDHPDSGATLNAKLFTMAVLLSSELLLNVSTVVDQGEIDKLGFVTEMAKQVHVGEGMTFKDFFPSLRWVVRDFELQLGEQTFQEYVDRALLPLGGLGKGAMDQNRIRRVIREHFPRIMGSKVCFPADDEDDLEEMDNQDATWEADHLLQEFRDDIAAVVAATVNGAPVKRVGEYKMDGSSLASWVELVITAVNKNMIDMPDAIESLIKKETRTVLEDALNEYNDIVSKVALPVEANEYDTAHGLGLDAACKICAAHSMIPVTEAAIKQVNDQTAILKEEAERTNLEKSRVHCEAKLEPLEHALKANVDENKFKSLDDYKRAHQTLEDNFKAAKVGPAAPAVWSEFSQRREADHSRVGMQNKLDQAEVNLAETKHRLVESEKARKEEQEEAARQAKIIKEDIQRLRREGEALEKRMAEDRAEFEKERQNCNGDSGSGTIVLMMGPHGGMGGMGGMGMPMMGMPMMGMPMMDGGGGFGGGSGGDPWAHDDSWI